VDWVENGNAPETITGIKYVNVRSPFMIARHSELMLILG